MYVKKIQIRTFIFNNITCEKIKLMTSVIKNLFKYSIGAICRPLLNWIINHKKADLQGELKFGIMGRSFIFIGQKWNTFTVNLNRKVFKISTLSEIKQLSDKQALVAGTELIAEIIIYSILIIVPILEWRKQARVAEVKEKKEQDHLQNLIETTKSLESENKALEERLLKLKSELKSLNVQKSVDLYSLYFPKEAEALAKSKARNLDIAYKLGTESKI